MVTSKFISNPFHNTLKKFRQPSVSGDTGDVSLEPELPGSVFVGNVHVLLARLQVIWTRNVHAPRILPEPDSR